MNSNNPVTIICAATGSGKSTQIPQYLLEYLMQTNTDRNEIIQSNPDIPDEKRANVRITITQPRRVAAISLAHRVSFEMKTKCGTEVGYAVRFDDKSTPNTKIRYVTDGVAVTEAVQELQGRQQNYKKHIFIVDEAHEKSVQTEIMLGILQRKLQNQNDKNTFKVVIMSATIDAEAFAQYFHTNNVLFIQGRTFPIRHFFTESIEKNYIEVASLTVIQAAQTKVKTILVFLPGERELRAVEATLQMMDKDKKLEILLLHSSLSQQQQMMIFQPRKCATRVVLSTNIAETSITVPEVDTVVDCGFVRIKVFEEGINRLITVPVSKAQVLQRSGRAGRTCPGKVYHLYTKETYNKLTMISSSELERCDLREVFIALLSQNIHDVSTFRFISEPGQQRRKHALEDLLRFKLIDPFYLPNDQKQICLRLTDLGRQISQIPLNIESSLTIIKAIQKENYQVLEYICQLLAILDSQEQLFISSSDNNQPARAVFKDSTSDHIMLLKLYQHFIHSENRQQFSKQHEISLNTMIYVEKAFRQIFQCVCDLLKKHHKQYEQLIKSKTLDILNIYSIEQNIDKIKNDILECLAYGFKHHIANAKNDNKTYMWKGHVCKIHPSSNVKYGEIILYHQMVQTTNLYMRIVSVLDPQLIQQD